MRIVILIRSLEPGGAERQAMILAKGLASKGHRVSLVSFYEGGVFQNGIEDSGVVYKSIGKTRRWNMVGFLFKLRRNLDRLDPDVVFSSMPPANIASLLTAGFGARRGLVWRLASSDMSLSEYDWFSAASYKVEAALSKFPTTVVCNSYAGREVAERRGFPKDNLRVVVNGIETDVFVRNAEMGRSIRDEWGIDNGRWVVGIVARGDPKKGHEDFLAAARMLRDIREDVLFACIGVDKGLYASKLMGIARAFGIEDAVVWRNFEENMVGVYNALSLNTLASRFGEGLPNSVGEAMSCGVPCVVTDVGDSACLVGDTGEVVARTNPEALMQGWQRLIARLENDESHTRARARERIVDKFPVYKYVNQTEEILLEACR